MASRQYLPFNYKIFNIPLIIYPVKDENPLEKIYNPSEKKQFLNFLNSLYKKNKEKLSIGEYHILFIWNLNNQRMTDIWIHNLTNWSDSGPLIHCLTYRNLSQCFDAGIASGDSLIVLGREEELRRKSNNLQKYINRNTNLPIFPKGFKPTKSFFTSIS